MATEQPEAGQAYLPAKELPLGESDRARLAERLLSRSLAWNPDHPEDRKAHFQDPAFREKLTRAFDTDCSGLGKGGTRAIAEIRRKLLGNPQPAAPDPLPNVPRRAS